jgi:hypothetical protein
MTNADTVEDVSSNASTSLTTNDPSTAISIALLSLGPPWIDRTVASKGAV